MLIPNAFVMAVEDVVYKHGAVECMKYKLRFKMQQLRNAFKSYTLTEILKRRKRQKDTAAYKQELIETKQSQVYQWERAI